MDINEKNQDPAPAAVNSAEQLRQTDECAVYVNLEQSGLTRFQQIASSSQFYTPIERVRAMIEAFDSPAAAAQVADQIQAAGGLAKVVQLPEASTRQWSALLTAAKVHQLLVFDEAHRISPQPANMTIETNIPKTRTSHRRVKHKGARAAIVEPNIKLPPAYRLASILQYVLTKGAYKRTVEPHLVDLYDEYSELIQNGEETRAKWVVLRGHVLILWSQLKRPIIALTGWLSTLKG